MTGKADHIFWTVAIITLALFGLAALSGEGSISFGGMILFAVLALIYLIPSIVAAKRAHRNRHAIMALNILLGWTFLGWVAALIWSLTANTQSEDQNAASTITHA